MLDKKTIKALLSEAKKNYKSSSKKFDKYDNTDDMNEMDRWQATVAWLENKLKVENDEL